MTKKIYEENESIFIFHNKLKVLEPWILRFILFLNGKHSKINMNEYNNYLFYFIQALRIDK